MTDKTTWFAVCVLRKEAMLVISVKCACVTLGAGYWSMPLLSSEVCTFCFPCM